MKTIQEFRGYITQVYPNTFRAHVFDLTEPGKPEEEWEVHKEKIPDDKQQFLEEGNTFEFKIFENGLVEWNFSWDN